jgi:predicted dehydrogenase
MIQVGIIGFGYWGPNIARNLLNAEGTHLRTICDLNQDRLRRAARLFPATHCTSELKDVLSDDEIDLVVIATPAETHFDLVMQAVRHGKHIWVEKPLAVNYSLAERILAEAASLDRMVFVDHTFVFTPAVQEMYRLRCAGRLGKPLYYDSVRVNLGIFRHDVNVIWDLATHDLAILDYLFDGRLPERVSCTGVGHFKEGHADLAHLTLHYDDGFIGHVHVNWLAPVKVRQVMLCGDRCMLIYDDNESIEKIKVYDNGIEVNHVADVYKLLVQFRTGDMHAPRLENVEALQNEVQNVIDSLEGKAKPLCTGEAGLRVIKVLEAADLSYRQGGAPVELSRLRQVQV